MSYEAAISENQREMEVWEEAYDKEMSEFGATHLFVEMLKKGISNDYTDGFYEHLQCLDPETLVDIIKEHLEGESPVEKSIVKHANDYADDIARKSANATL